MFNELLTNQISSIVTAGGFLVYLYKKSQMDKSTFDKFNETINNHLLHALKTEEKLTKTLQKLVNCIDRIKK